MNDTRLVPMTREERDWLAGVWIEYLGNPNPCPLVAAWDAAPADATEAFCRAMDESNTDTIDWTDDARAVLRALGMPDA